MLLYLRCTHNINILLSKDEKFTYKLNETLICGTFPGSWPQGFVTNFRKTVKILSHVECKYQLLAPVLLLLRLLFGG